MHQRSWIAVLGALAACSGSGGTQQPVDITVDTYNVALAGAFIPAESERRAALLAALAQNPADVLCVQEAWRQSDKEAIINAARARFPHSLSFQHHLDTPSEEIAVAGCTADPLPTTAPCAGEPVQSQMNAAIECLKANCSTVPGSDDGQTTSTDCAEAQCFLQAAALLVGGEAGRRCYGCVAPNLPTETFSSLRNQCTTNPRAGLGFGGQSGVLLLSKHPLSNTGSVVLPGTWNRRVIARATVTLPNQAKVDVYCNHLSAIFDGLAYPYTGRYGCGNTDARGWEAEQKAQIQRLVAYVQSSTGSGKALILGDFNVGREHTVNGTVVTAAEGAANYELLAASFTPAVPASYVPACTFCSDNPLAGVDHAHSVWIDHIFLRNIPLASVRSLERTYTDSVVGATIEGSATTVPRSDHYGLRAVITISP